MSEVSAGYFPDYDVQWDYTIARRKKTQIVESLTGAEQRRRLYPARESSGTGHRGGYAVVTASSDAYTPEERFAVADFLDQMEGAFKAFYFFRRDRDNFSNYYVGDVAAAASIIIPFKDVVVTQVTVNDVVKAFTVTANIGQGAESRINFTAGAQTGAVRVTLRGRQRLLVRCVSDEMVETFLANVMKDNVITKLQFIERR